MVLLLSFAPLAVLILVVVHLMQVGEPDEHGAVAQGSGASGSGAHGHDH